MTDEFSFIHSETEADWRQWGRRNVQVTEEGVTLAERATLSASRLGVRVADLDTTPSGNLVVVLPSGAVSVYATGADRLKRLSLAGDAGIESPVAVGATRDRIYLVDGETGRFGAFSRSQQRLEATVELDVDPLAVVGSQRRVYVLDAVSDGEATIYGLEADESPRPVVEGLADPVDVSVSPAETLYVLADGGDGATLWRCESDVGRFDDPVEVAVPFPAGFTPTCVSSQTEETLIFTGTDGDGRARVVEYETATGTVDSFSAPDEWWTAPVSGTVGTAGDRERVYLRSASDEAWAVTKEYLNRKDPENTRYEGRLTRRVDAGDEDTQWHRITLEADQLGPDRRIDVTYYASDGDVDGIDDLSQLPVTQRQADGLATVGVDGLWDLVECSPEQLTTVLPETPKSEIGSWIDRAQTLIDEEFDRREDVEEAHDPTDILLKDATGRYLHVEVRLVGRRDVSPRLRSIRAYCPRRSYIRYLPEIYRETSDQSSFLSQFLSLFESVFVDIEDEIHRRGKYFDPQEIPTDYLPWLNEWLAVETGEGWPEQARRELLQRAIELYTRRGTRRGLVDLIRLYFDHVDLPEQSWERSLVRIERRLETLVDRGYLSSHDAAASINRYRERSEARTVRDIYVFEHSQLDVLSDADPDQPHVSLVGHPRRFQVLVHPSLPDEHIREIEAIIGSNTPIYTDSEVTQLSERTYLGGNTYLGINTACSTRESRLGETVLGQETILEPNT